MHWLILAKHFMLLLCHTSAKILKGSLLPECIIVLPDNCVGTKFCHVYLAHLIAEHFELVIASFWNRHISNIFQCVAVKLTLSRLIKRRFAQI